MQITSIKNMNKSKITEIIQMAQAFKNGKLANYQNHSVAAIFLEPSTRTLCSFKKAALNLKINFFDINIDKSSFNKGESLEDTLLNQKAMKINNFIIRSSKKEYWKDMHHKFNIINGGDGTKNHPSQALLDAMTIREHFGTLENLKILIVGDIKHSRVYASNKELLEKFNSQVYFMGPVEFGGTGTKIDNHLSNYDVIIMLRIEHERHKKLFIDIDYNKNWRLNKNNLKKMKKNAIFMQPGPVNRGVEITEEILYKTTKDKILAQVENGVYIRMAFLEKLCKNI